MEDSIVDGPGIRTALFAQGCTHNCPGCHNPQSHPFGVGENWEIDALTAHILANPLAHSVTFSGGEPFQQAEGFAALAKQLRAKNYDIACYTGYTFEHLRTQGTPAQQALLSLLDVLIDSPFILAQRNLDLLFRGSENQRILDVPKSLAAGNAIWCDAKRWIG